MSMLSRRETISYGKPNRLKTFRPDFRPGGEGPQRLRRGGESGALGRRTTRTTELYYGRTRPESSLAEFEQAFAELVMCVSK